MVQQNECMHRKRANTLSLTDKNNVGGLKSAPSFGAIRPPHNWRTRMAKKAAYTIVALLGVAIFIWFVSPFVSPYIGELGANFNNNPNPAAQQATVTNSTRVSATTPVIDSSRQKLYPGFLDAAGTEPAPCPNTIEWLVTVDAADQVLCLPIVAGTNPNVAVATNNDNAKVLQAVDANSAALTTLKGQVDANGQAVAELQKGNDVASPATGAAGSVNGIQPPAEGMSTGGILGLALLILMVMAGLIFVFSPETRNRVKTKWANRGQSARARGIPVRHHEDPEWSRDEEELDQDTRVGQPDMRQPAGVGA